MKKFLLLFSITSSFFIFLKINTVFAQSCNCVRTGHSYNDTTKVTEYYCQAQNTYCTNGGFCKCPTLYDTDRSAPCDPGACLEPSRCEDLPSAYCIDECNSPIPNQICDSGLKCCSITTADRDPNCVNNCNTQCVFGNNLPGFTCKIESGARGTQTCACYPPSITPVPGATIPPLDVWGPCGANVGIDTAIGCIPVDPSLFVQTFITLIIGLAGVIAFLLMVFASIQIILAGGNPEKLQAGKEMLTSAIIGLILIIFSTVILELIGVHILQIPGFLEFK